jgi:glycosyltransferase involved in cell wall biosynthesis/predicted metal-dependent phosphoesterase TrpH
MHDFKTIAADPRERGCVQTATTSATRADLHCHSSASALARLEVQRAVALPECATPPQEVYELAKRRRMDFVTITDHDTIHGVLEIADQPDVFVSEELTAWFAEEPQAVHVLCWGITPDDHEWLQAHQRDVVACADYLHRNEIACALAHPFFNVAAPLSSAHRRVLAQLFPTWETRNGTRPRELNAPAALYIDTHGGTGVGGSDDHAGIDIGRTFTEAAGAGSPAEFLQHLRAGRVTPCGDEGSVARWAHGALVLTARAMAARSSQWNQAAPPDPGAILALAENIIRERVGGGERATGLGLENVRRLLLGWLREMELDPRLDALLRTLQGEETGHAALALRARRIHERKLARAMTQLVDGERSGRIEQAIPALVGALLPVVPYIPASAMLAGERAKLVARDGDPTHVAVVADGLAHVHGVGQTLAQLRERGLRGYEIDLIGTDANVDRRLPAVTEIELPHYPGLSLGVPSLSAVAEALTERHYDLVHVCAPGPAGIAAALMTRVMALPLLGSYHTELQAYVRTRTGDSTLEATVGAVMATFYASCAVVLSPSNSADASLERFGIPRERILRWQRGVDTMRFSPARRGTTRLPGRFNILYVGRISREKGVDLLADAYLEAHQRDRRLHLVLAGRGPEEEDLRKRLGARATFLGWLEGDELANTYASADLLVFPSTTDTFGQVILEAQASGLPVLAVRAGGPTELIEDGRTGCLVSPHPEELATAIRGIAGRKALLRRLTSGALLAVRERTWERSLAELAAGYAHALSDRGAAAAGKFLSDRATLSGGKTPHPDSGIRQAA